MNTALIHKHVLLYTFLNISLSKREGRRGRDRKVVGFSTTCAISVHHIYGCGFEPRSWRGVLDTALCDKVCQWLATGWWFSPGTPVSSTNKTDLHDIIEILLKVAFSTINQQNHLKQKHFKIRGVLTKRECTLVGGRLCDLIVKVKNTSSLSHLWKSQNIKHEKVIKFEKWEKNI
jgi:hypothetical protein